MTLHVFQLLKPWPLEPLGATRIEPRGELILIIRHRNVIIVVLIKMDVKLVPVDLMFFPDGSDEGLLIRAGSRLRILIDLKGGLRLSMAEGSLLDFRVGKD